MAKKAFSTSGAPVSSTTNVNPVPVTTTISQIDIDELAKEKVDEVERSLDSLNKFNTDYSSWLSILKQIITAADLHRTNDKNDNSPQNSNNKQSQKQQQVDADESIYAYYGDDNEQFNAEDLTEQFASNSVKWTIRVRAFKLVHRIIKQAIDSNSKTNSKSSLLVHLADLIRLSFVAATSPYDDLKLQGFEMFKVLIEKFSRFEEKEFPGHSILEQYKTQVLSALKPSFDLDAPPYITAIASQVCSLWLCNGLEKTELDLKRTYQLMLTTIDKLENQNINQNSKLYTESELEQERIDILGSWAQLYITGKNINDNYYLQDKDSFCTTLDTSNHLNQLVKPQINSLIDKWWEALKDYALLIMPSSKIIDVSHDNNHVYTRDVALRLFSPVWPKLVMASIIWLCYDLPKIKSEQVDSKKINSEIELDYDICDKEKFEIGKIKYFKFICGIIMKELYRFVNQFNNKCDNIEAQIDFLPDATLISIRSLHLLINNEEFVSYLSSEIVIAKELYTILYNILIIVSKRKGQLIQVLKILIDKIFKLTLANNSIDSNHIKFGVAQLVTLIENDINLIHETNNVENNNNLEDQKLILYLRCCNLVNIIKTKPCVATEDVSLREAFIEVFKSILSSENPSFSISYLNLLKDLHKHLPKEYSSSTLVTLFNSKANIASRLLDLIIAEDNKERDKNILYLEAFTKSLNSDIKCAEDYDRHKLIEIYQRIFIEVFPKCQNFLSNQTSDLISKNKIVDLLDSIIKNLENIKLDYEEDFEKSIIPNLKKVYEVGLKQHQDMKNSIEKKQGITKGSNKKFNDDSRNKLAAKKPSKIVLKSNFSNFYDKK